jgi:hypothetical protein
LREPLSVSGVQRSREHTNACGDPRIARRFNANVLIRGLTFAAMEDADFDWNQPFPAAPPFGRFSLRRVRQRQLHQQALKSSSLSKLDNDEQLSLHVELLRQGAPLGTLLAFMGVVVLLFVGFVPIETLGATWLWVLVATGYLFEIVGTLMIVSSLGSEHRAAMIMWRTILLLEDDANRWRDASFRGKINRNLESIAKRIERVPRELRPVDRVTTEVLTQRARAVAAELRSLKTWNAFPKPTTYSDLIQRLTKDLQVLSAGRWFDLPEQEPGAVDARRQRWIATVVGLVILAGLILAVVFGGETGRAVAGVATAVLIPVSAYMGTPLIKEIAEGIGLPKGLPSAPEKKK